MSARIFRSVVVTALLAVLLTAALLVPALYGVFEERIAEEMRMEAGYIARALDLTQDDTAYFANFSPQNRVTLIAPDGKVLFDSENDAAQMENHALRPEIVQALADGSGQSIRHSDTLSETTIYFAQKLASGNVLRIASTRSSSLGVFASIAPQIVCMLLAVGLLSFWIARRSARSIVSPINALDLDAPLKNDTYDELAPLMTRMEHQHVQIRRQMQALERARAELTAIMENMREGMVLLDRRNNVLSMNGSAARIFGVGAQERIGENLLSLSRDIALLELVLAAQHGECGDMLLGRNARTYQLLASPVLQDEEAHGVVLLVLDVTERFAAESSRREFTANVSHELKTPLTSISGFAEIIRDGIAQPQDVPGFAGRIHSEAQRLISLVNDILELSRLDEKRGIGDREMVSLRPVLEGLAEDLGPNMREKKLALDISGDGQIMAYPVLLREMLFNLIDNAVKYTPDGGRISAEIRSKGDFIACAVSDNGIGIPAEHQPHVFERFYRVDKSHSRATGGTGLGLAIVKHAAEIHQAQLQLDSEPGRGTSITLRFRKAPN